MARVDFFQANAGTYSGNMSGAGSVLISQEDVTFSWNEFLYTGGTTVDVGSTLIGTTTSLQGVFNNQGSVQFMQSGIGTFAGNIDGFSAVEIGGGGIVNVLGYQQLHLGGTSTVDASTTLIGNTSSLQGKITDNGLLAFNETANGTFAGVISGTGGGVQIGGTGTVTLSGTANTYTGGTTIDERSGTLVVASDRFDRRKYQRRYRWRVDGRFGNNSESDSQCRWSTIQPGTVGAPLQINGNFIQGAGSKYSAELNPTGSDQINVAGTAQINNGTVLNLALDSGTYTGRLEGTRSCRRRAV